MKNNNTLQGIIMTEEEFKEGLIVAIDLPSLENIEWNKPFPEIDGFDSLATLGVMTFIEIEFDKSIEGEWIWDDSITPAYLYKLVIG